jgi:hypothetical protein
VAGRWIFPRTDRLPEFLGQGERYRLIRFIGEDWLGQIWHAEDRADRIAVTIRIVREPLTTNPELVEAFHDRLMALYPRLQHPNIARVAHYNDGKDGPVEFIVMEELQGQTLTHRLKRGPPIKREEAFTIGAVVAEVLQVTHDQGFAHEALTAHSVMLTDDSSVKIMDFGLSALRPDSYHFPTAEGSPGDVRALGSLLREMLGSEAASAEPPAGESVELIRLWQSSLDPNPAERPTAQALVLAFRTTAGLEEVPGPGRAPEDAGGGLDAPIPAEPPGPVNHVRGDASTAEDPAAEPSGEVDPTGGLASVGRLRADIDRADEPEENENESTVVSRHLPGATGWLWAGGVMLLTALLVFLFARPWVDPATRQPARTPSGTTNSEAIVMPDLRGMTLAEARSLLEQANLTLARDLEAHGEPGVVVASDPGLGRLVPPGTAVTIYIGAEKRATEGRPCHPCIRVRNLS